MPEPTPEPYATAENGEEALKEMIRIRKELGSVPVTIVAACVPRDIIQPYVIGKDVLPEDAKTDISLMMRASPAHKIAFFPDFSVEATS